MKEWVSEGVRCQLIFASFGLRVACFRLRVER